jgi:hypothetical protein
MPQIKGSHRQLAPIAGGYNLVANPVTDARLRVRAIHESLRELNGVELIYAIRCRDGIIKIGHTRDLMSRRRHFASSDNPEAILSIQHGTYEDEQALHATLKASVARGREYYHPTPEVLAYINGVRATLGVDPA